MFPTEKSIGRAPSTPNTRRTSSSICFSHKDTFHYLCIKYFHFYEWSTISLPKSFYFLLSHKCPPASPTTAGRLQSTLFNRHSSIDTLQQLHHMFLYACISICMCIYRDFVYLYVLGVSRLIRKPTERTVLIRTNP